MSKGDYSKVKLTTPTPGRVVNIEARKKAQERYLSRNNTNPKKIKSNIPENQRSAEYAKWWFDTIFTPPHTGWQTEYPFNLIPTGDLKSIRLDRDELRRTNIEECKDGWKGITECEENFSRDDIGGIDNVEGKLRGNSLSRIKRERQLPYRRRGEAYDRTDGHVDMGMYCGDSTGLGPPTINGLKTLDCRFNKNAGENQLMKGLNNKATNIIPNSETENHGPIIMQDVMQGKLHRYYNIGKKENEWLMKEATKMAEEFKTDPSVGGDENITGLSRTYKV